MREHKTTFSKELMKIFAGIFLVAILLITATSAVVTRRITIDNYFSYASQALKGVNFNLEVIMDDVEALSRVFLSDDRIQEWLAADAEDSDYSALLRSAMEIVVKLTIDREFVESVLIYNLDGNGFMSGAGDSMISDFSVIQSQSWYQEIVDARGMFQWIGAQFEGIRSNKDRVLLVRVINKTDSLDPAGLVVFILKNDYFTEIVEEAAIPELGKVCITDEKGSVLFASGQMDAKEEAAIAEYNARMEKKEEAYMQTGDLCITSWKNNTLNWGLLCINQELVVSAGWYTTLFIILTITLLVLIFSVLIYRWFAGHINGALQTLVYAMGNAEKEKYKSEIEISTGIVEFDRLVGEYNHMIHRINVLINEVMQEKLSRREAQLESLQSKINPHFLYNTLDSINWKAEANGQKEISEMIVGLSKMFRFSLGKGEREVRLKDEIENVRCYLMLQKKRFEDEFSFLIDVPERVSEYRIIKFILQPLVENSVLHGLQVRNGKGYIGVLAEEKGGYLELNVVDDGVGVDEKQIAEILEGTGESKHRHGIYNVNERLKLSYGEESGLHFYNRPNGGTKVSIRIYIDKLGGR